ncbi:hypothetical protein NEOLEDRAFT_1181109 [Neolentinus lepideus HHB14362 ss-1]|uniref:L domain-like protein n=1 Tax=Neolentinus lepideus HHB14362 ss-1 TaxID=1314782 RepID=A0A165QCF5_9AGAM|nr:hypothetical protein NEOLEDRAFT_1181109 [Neolentinus lepideus HHB14362 ss-1]
MEHEPGDDYLRRIANFIRTYENNLAQGGFQRRRRQIRPSESSVLNPLSWLGLDGNAAQQNAKPMVLTLDLHHLLYILIRLEAIGMPVGSLDVKVDGASRPMNYINVFSGSDKSETLSLASFRSSLSAVSRLSLGSGWWGRAEPPSPDSELKYIYSSFTKLPALSLTAPGPKMIAELANEPPNDNAIPLYSFKNLQSLECLDIDPRTLLGWDRLAESLWSLTIKRSGLEDVTDVFIGAVMDDQARSDGMVNQTRRRKLGPTRQTSFYATSLPESVPEDEGEEDPSTPKPGEPEEPPAPKMSSVKWASLRRLSLSDNELTFIPNAPLLYLTSVTHLDLSSNLLVSVPEGLSSLYNLISLNLSDNMIDSVLGIYKVLGSVLQLNLSSNRLESLCGLERLLALERVDLRDNQVEESAEVGRLATLPNIAEVWVEGNPLEENYRVRSFEYFWKEGKNITLDGTPPGFYEKSFMTSPPPEQMTSSRPVSTAYSPPVVPVGSASSSNTRQPTSVSPAASPAASSPSSQTTSPHLGPTGSAIVSKARRKKNKRIVDLNGKDECEHGIEGKKHGHGRTASEGKALRPKERREASPAKAMKVRDFAKGASQLVEEDMPVATSSNLDPSPSTGEQSSRPPLRSRHSRSHTSYVAHPVSNIFLALPPNPSELPPVRTPEISPTSPGPPATQTVSHRSATISGKSKSALRRNRVSASTYEAPGDKDSDEEGNAAKKEAEAFRARIEALRSDMGEGWLKVFSQTQLESPRA